MRKLFTLLCLIATLSLSGCGYNTFQSTDEQITASWSEVLNQYQRRSDLIPNLVATVKGESGFEQETLVKVVEARAKATSIQATPELINNPEAFKKFQAVQGELSGALRTIPTLNPIRVFRSCGLNSKAQKTVLRLPVIAISKPFRNTTSRCARFLQI